MTRTFLIALAMVATAGCAAIDNLGRDDKNAYENPFYAKYLNTGSQLDTDISRTLESLRQNPHSAEAHNRLGAMLVEKGFPKDAEREFERAIDADDDYYAAWYNLGLVRAAHGDELGARRAFRETVDLKPGHAAALFQLGLVEEKRHHRDRAVELYAKAYSINPALMDVRVNPRVLDSKLMHLALLRMYPKEHTRRSMQFQGGPVAAAPAPATTPQVQEAPSPQQPASSIVTPVAPTTDPSQQAPPAPAPRRPRRTTPPATPPATPTPAPPATNT
ncbi:MAG TPA: tetratricopeptide repeat protein [Thermoanaerobaculia bacterium]|nr:tetratricopeptide repeat protein [Thermoanaerobaculia bacterium]